MIGNISCDSSDEDTLTGEMPSFHDDTKIHRVLNTAFLVKDYANDVSLKKFSVKREKFERRSAAFTPCNVKKLHESVLVKIKQEPLSVSRIKTEWDIKTEPTGNLLQLQILNNVKIENDPKRKYSPYSKIVKKEEPDTKIKPTNVKPSIRPSKNIPGKSQALSQQSNPRTSCPVRKDSQNVQVSQETRLRQIVQKTKCRKVKLHKRAPCWKTKNILKISTKNQNHPRKIKRLTTLKGGQNEENTARCTSKLILAHEPPKCESVPILSVHHTCEDAMLTPSKKIKLTKVSKAWKLFRKD